MILLPGVLLIDFWGICGWKDPVPSTSQPVPLDTKQRSFLVKQYETAVKEISHRLSEESSLFALKFSLIGAVLGSVLVGRAVNVKATEEHTLARSSVTAICCWTATVVAVVVDLRKQLNSDLIRTIGAWIQTAEINLYGGRDVGWERYFPTSTLFKSELFPFLRCEREVMTWVLFAAMVHLFMPFDEDNTSAQTRKLWRVSLPFGVVCIGLLGVHALHFHPGADYFGITVALLTVALMAAFAGLCLHSMRSFPESIAGQDFRNISNGI